VNASANVVSLDDTVTFAFPDGRLVTLSVTDAVLDLDDLAGEFATAGKTHGEFLKAAAAWVAKASGGVAVTRGEADEVRVQLGLLYTAKKKQQADAFAAMRTSPATTT
jgi:hypothetical protein